MITTIFTPCKVPGSMLIALSITLLSLVLTHFAQIHLASAGFHRLASVSRKG